MRSCSLWDHHRWTSWSPGCAVEVLTRKWTFKKNLLQLGLRLMPRKLLGSSTPYLPMTMSTAAMPSSNNSWPQRLSNAGGATPDRRFLDEKLRGVAGSGIHLGGDRTRRNR